MFQYVKSEKLIISHLQMNLIALFYLVLLVVGSPGDKLKRFKRCNKECQQVNCASGELHSGISCRLTLIYLTYFGPVNRIVIINVK